MRQGGEHGSLAPKRLHARTAQGVRQNLDDNLALHERRLFRQVDLSRAALAHEGEQAVVTDHGALHQAAAFTAPECARFILVSSNTTVRH